MEEFTSDDKNLEYVLAGLFVLSAVFYIIAIMTYRKVQNLLFLGVKTKGKVIDVLEESQGQEGKTYRSVFEYRGLGGEMVSFKSAIATNPARHKVGADVTIVYSKDGKQQKEVSFVGLYIWPTVTVFFGTVCLIVGIILYPNP
ncbi:MAG: hypothetical protein SchgKO_21440 [Schleiferiaceae bacterium]